MKLVAILLALTLPVLVLAEENGSMPYATLYGFFHDAAGIDDSNLHAMIAVESDQPGVKPSQISLTIQASKGPIKLNLADDGEIRDFPMSWDLLGENPPILSNQPKGTLRLRVAINLKVPDSLTFSYARLNELLQEANAAIRKQAGEYSGLAPQGKGLIFEFRDASQPTINVTSKSGTKTLRPDQNGDVTLPMDSESLADNPSVKLSEKPVKVSLDFPPPPKSR
jgi:hypothetical protein